MEGEKVSKCGEAFFFFFFASHSSKPLKFVLEIFYQEKAFHARRKNQEK